MKILITGVAGFIGYHVAEALLGRDISVIGVDSMNSYYDVRLKKARLARLQSRDHFAFHQVDIADYEALSGVAVGVDVVVHLAAQAGVRYSIENPFAYASSNLTGHLSMLELARRHRSISHFVYASSSSVYGAGSSLPYNETARADLPQSLYAATKRGDELMSAAYAHLYGLRQTGLRFFTVYGPWGRPDMAYFGFAEAIMDRRTVTIYDGGTLKRDFTYIDDIVTGILGVIDHPPASDGEHRIYNIGNNRSELVIELVELLEIALDRKAIIQNLPRPAADPVETCADIDSLHALTGYTPKTMLIHGIPHFVSWFHEWRTMRGLTE